GSLPHRRPVDGSDAGHASRRTRMSDRFSGRRAVAVFAALMVVPLIARGAQADLLGTDAGQTGVCTGPNDPVCVAPDQCHMARVCDPVTGTCFNPPAPDGTACDDGNACTRTDASRAGVCTGTNSVRCTA